MSRIVAWTLYLADSDPDPDTTTPRRWWSGEGDLVLEGHTWRGASGPAGALMEIGPVETRQGLPGRRTTFRLAVVPASVQRLLQVDLGGVELQIGFLGEIGGVLTRIPRYAEGRLSEHVIRDGELTGTIETWLGDVDRGRPLEWSHETQQARSPGDESASQAAVGAVDRAIRWPPSAA